MAKPKLRSATTPVVPRDEGFLTIRSSLSNDVKAVFTVHDTHIGLVNDTADLTVNGSFFVSTGAKGVLNLPDGTKTLQGGENVVINYNDDGTVKISTQAGEDISYILSTVESFDSRIIQTETKVDQLQSQQQQFQSSTTTTLSTIQTSLNQLNTQGTTILQTYNMISNSFLSLEERVMSAENTAQNILTSESAQNSRLSILEGGLYEERLARTNADYNLTSQYNSLNSLYTSLTERTTALEIVTGTLSTEISDTQSRMLALSSSVASDIKQLRALMVSASLEEISEYLIIDALSGTFASKITSLESLTSQLGSDVSSLMGSYSSLDNRVSTLEFASGSFSSLIGDLNSSLGTISLDITDLSSTLTSMSSSVASDINELRMKGGAASATVGQFAFNETPSGVIDGVNNTFELANTPQPTSSLMLFLNGQLLKAGENSDYILNGKIITFVNMASPAQDDVIIATYQYLSATRAFKFNESITLVTSGPVLHAVLEFEPDPPSSLMLFYNGQLLTAGENKDYTLSGKSLVMGEISHQEDDVCLATYSHY